MWDIDVYGNGLVVQTNDWYWPIRGKDKEPAKTAQISADEVTAIFKRLSEIALD